MMPRLRHLGPYLAAVIVSGLLIEIGWMRLHSFWGLGIASAASLGLVVWALGAFTEPWPAATEPAPSRAAGTAAGPSLPGLALRVCGLGCVALAWSLALRDQQLGALAALILAALCWRPSLSMHTEEGLRRDQLALGMLAVMLTGAAFRFYQAGAIPAGLITVDEPRLIYMGREILNGNRDSFHIFGSEGNAPFWFQGICLRVFGDDILGFRMAALIPGLMLVGLIALLAQELDGSRFGLIAGAFTALCTWPVAFSRAEYLVSSSLVPIVAVPWLLLRGLRRGSVLSLAASGFFLGLCFNIYNPARLVVPLFALLLGLLWVRRPGWRQALQASWQPLLAGLFIGLAPLLLWALRDPAAAQRAYFGKLDMDFIAGQNVLQAHGFLAKSDLIFGRILPNLPRLLTMFTTHGGMRPWYFKLDQPVLDQASLFLLLAGLATALVRFRQPAYAFLVAWWLTGLVPTLLADPAYHMDERRIMLALPPTMLLAAAGLHNGIRLFSKGLARRQADLAWLAVGVVFFALLGRANWHTYFTVIQGDRGHQNYNHDNFDNMLRAIARENVKAPVFIISARKANEDNWWGANPMNELQEHWEVLHPIPYVFMAAEASYFAEGGLFGLLRKTPRTEALHPDPLVVLTPYHYYLEPLLLELGGERVAEIPVVKALDGPNYTDVGMAWGAPSATRLIRLRNFDPAKVEALGSRRLLPFTIEELQPPAGLGTREDLAKLFVLDPAHIKAMENYVQAPQRWRATKASTFSLPDPWFWVTANNFPGSPQLPLRLRAKWALNVPSSGSYSLGASTSVYLGLKVDGRPAYTYIPRDRVAHESREGYLGAPMSLSAGPHTLELEQVVLSSSGSFNQVLRLLWQRPGEKPETLPLEYLAPIR